MLIFLRNPWTKGYSPRAGRTERQNFPKKYAATNGYQTVTLLGLFQTERYQNETWLALQRPGQFGLHRGSATATSSAQRLLVCLLLAATEPYVKFSDSGGNPA
jgi:hypothetical protein